MIIEINEDGEAIAQINPALIMKVSFIKEQGFHLITITMSDGSQELISRVVFDEIKNKLPWFDRNVVMAEDRKPPRALGAPFVVKRKTDGEST